MLRCPICKSIHHVQVLIEVWAEVTQSEKDREGLGASIIDGDHEWGPSSTVKCVNPKCQDENELKIIDEFEEGSESERSPDPDEDDCDCLDRSWYGSVHDSACPLAGKTRT